MDAVKRELNLRKVAALRTKISRWAKCARPSSTIVSSRPHSDLTPLLEDMRKSFKKRDAIPISDYPVLVSLLDPIANEFEESLATRIITFIVQHKYPPRGLESTLLEFQESLALVFIEAGIIPKIMSRLFNPDCDIDTWDNIGELLIVLIRSGEAAATHIIADGTLVPILTQNLSDPNPTRSIMAARLIHQIARHNSLMFKQACVPAIPDVIRCIGCETDHCFFQACSTIRCLITVPAIKRICLANGVVRNLEDGLANMKAIGRDVENLSEIISLKKQLKRK